MTDDKPQQPVKVTHLQLMDGCNNTMLERLAMNIPDERGKLKEGNVMRLQMYPELTIFWIWRMAKPTKFSLVGYNALPMAIWINDPSECGRSSLEKKLKGNEKTLDIAEYLECNESCCSLYVIRMVLCVCRINISLQKWICKHWRMSVGLRIRKLRRWWISRNDVCCISGLPPIYTPYSVRGNVHRFLSASLLQFGNRIQSLTANTGGTKPKDILVGTLTKLSDRMSII